MSMDRRSFLVSLALIPPALYWSSALLAAGSASDAFREVSRIITGADNLTPGAAARIEALLTERHAGFAAHLAALHKTLAASTSREAGLSALSGTDLDTALIIAKPWYLGYVGTPSGRILEDDAAFATFLEMQAYAKTGGIIPAQSYPPGPAGWWRDTPRGVDASDLPEGATTWAYQPLKHYTIATPDPAWHAYAEGRFDSIEAARAALGQEARK
ncbi:MULTISPECIES: sugar dehydrogenase complex small subunit [Pseudomonas]|uniref:sugar dehydrogenase complex small subunit n=1 Tax=Pseudomonas TaxID=286 RepID=UPI00242DFC39|nr:sugar dehydrogenase complex small subunit [Pseudomonas helleri]